MKNSNIIIILVIVIGLVGGIFLLSRNIDTTTTAERTAQPGSTSELTAPIEEPGDQVVQNDSMDKDVADSGDPGDAYSPTAGNYQDYDPALLANADMGDVVLFFKAGWCPTCNALDRDINTKLDQLPEDVTVLKVDYDSNQTLKQKYGVKIQHTLIQVDSEGNEIKQWQGSLKLEQLLSEIV